MVRLSNHFQHRSRVFAAVSILLAFAAFADGCNSDLGVSDGLLGSSGSSTFSGISRVTLLSPTSAQVAWNASSQYSSYRVYAAGISQPLAMSIFSSTSLTGLSPGTVYNLSVAGIPSGGGAAVGASQTISVQTWPMFTGAAQLTSPTPTSLSVNWSFPESGPTFKIYVNEGSPPTNFTTPVVTTQALSANLTKWNSSQTIKPSTTYYVVVRATYLDGTTDSNTNALSVVTRSAIDPLPTVKVAPVVLGSLPVFEVSGALAGYKTTFSRGGVTLGQITGNGAFTLSSSLPLAAGVNTIDVKVDYNTYSTTLTPLTVLSRTPKTSFHEAPKLAGGKGPQHLGATMAVGDFNCDGKDDLAVGAPMGTFYVPDLPTNITGPILRSGGVYVFYGGGVNGLVLPGQTGIPDPSLSPTPGTLNPLLIPFPGKSYSGAPVVNQPGSVLFGASLAAGNINGDKAGSPLRQCDDLVIGAPGAHLPSPYPQTMTTANLLLGSAFVYYGSSNGLQLGTPVLNQPACSAGVCSPQQIVLRTSSSQTALVSCTGGVNGTPYSSTYFGGAVTIGNFYGNDDYHEVAISAPGYCGDAYHDSGANVLQGRVFLYSADSTGLVLTSSTNEREQFAKAYIKAPAGSVRGSAELFVSNYPGIFINGYFGIALAAADLSGDGLDDLLVGSPSDTESGGSPSTVNRGSVYYYVNPGSNAGIGFTSAPNPTKTLQSGITYTNSQWPFWGGTIAKAGDVNGDGYVDAVIGTSLGYNWPGSGGNYGNQVVTVIYGSASGPQGFDANTGLTPSKPVSPVYNTTACNTAACPATSGACKVQHFTSGAGGVSWLNTSWGGLSYSASLASTNSILGQNFSMTGLSVSGARAHSMDTVSGFTPLPFGGQTVDNDTYADVIIGNPAMGTNGSGGGAVLRGSCAGLNPAANMITPIQASDLDSFGMSAALGLFKSLSGSCNQVAQVALGGPNSSTLNYPATPFGGIVFTFRPASGCSLPASVTSPTDQIRSNLAAEVPGTGHVGFQRRMHAQVAGDINRDGYTDVVVSMYVPPFIPGDSLNREASPNTTNPSIAAIYYGSASGIDFSVAPSLNPVNTGDPILIAWNNNQPFCGLGQYDSFACDEIPDHSLITPAGDINGDGYDDIVSPPGNAATGLKVYYGSSAGLQTSGGPIRSNLPPNPQFQRFAVPESPLYSSGAPFSFYKNRGAFGDFNGDGFSDLAVGEVAYNEYFVPGNPQNGQVLVFYGSANGLQIDAGAGQNRAHCTSGYSATYTFSGGQTTTLCSSAASRLLAYSNPCDGNGGGGTAGQCIIQMLRTSPAFGDATYGSNFGTSVSNVGDVNGDGYDDLAVAAGGDTIYSGAIATGFGGVVVLYLGGPRGLVVNVTGQAPTLTSTSPPVYSPMYISPVTTVQSTLTNRQLGYQNIAPAGDINGDGYADFLVDASAHNTVLVSGQQSGNYVFYGCKAGTNSCPSLSAVYGVTWDGSKHVSATLDHAGSSVCTATAGSQTCVVKDLGAAPCVAGGACAIQYVGLSTSTPNFTTYGPFGRSGSGVGDINADGYSDLLVTIMDATSRGPASTSSGNFSLNTFAPGAAVLFSGSPTGLITGVPSQNPQCLQGAGCKPYLILPSLANWGAAGTTMFRATGEVPNYQGNPLSYGTRFDAQFFLGQGLRTRLTDFNGDGKSDFFMEYETAWSADRTSFQRGALLFFQ